MNNSNKIITNTIVVYSRVAITTIVSLLSSRWILKALGVEDFGIYNLVAGLLAMLMVFNSSMAAATQRFLSYSIGASDKKKVIETFNMSFMFHLLVGVLVVLLTETIGRYFLLNVLSVPVARTDAALFCLHCLSISTFFSVISIPFTAMLFSYENMLYMSIIQICETILKLLAALLLLYYFGDRLKLYAISVTGISVLAIVLFAVYCRVKYDCCRISIRIRSSLSSFFKEYLYFACWSLIGSVSTMLKNQGVAMLLNTFYGVVINAAYGIANQIKGQLMFVSTSVLTAARPQIVQSEGRGDRQRVHILSSSACKFSFLLLSFISIPLIIEMPAVLKIWLNTVPDYTCSFSIIVIVTNLFFQFTIGAFLPLESVGKIKKVQLITGVMHCSVIPIGYILLKFGFKPDFLLLFVMVEEILSFLVILYYSSRITGMDSNVFIRKTFIPPLIVAGISTGICLFVHFFIGNMIVRIISVFITSTVCLSFLSYVFALEDYEKSKVKEIIFKTKNRFLRHENA